MKNDTVNLIQGLHKDGYLKADFQLFGVPETREEAEVWMKKYQDIRNKFFEMSLVNTEEVSREYNCDWIKEVHTILTLK